MSEPKFTKGPWFVRYGIDERKGSRYPYQIVGPSPELQIITSWGAISRRAKEEGQANAHLIAAGPDMYVALEQLIDHEPCEYDHHGNCQAHNLGNPCGVAMAIKALAKARGEVK